MTDARARLAAALADRYRMNVSASPSPTSGWPSARWSPTVSRAAEAMTSTRGVCERDLRAALGGEGDVIRIVGRAVPKPAPGDA